MNAALRSLRALGSRAVGKSSSAWLRFRTPRLRLLMFRDPVDCVLYALALAKPDAFFVQIGSNDATFGDPIQPFLPLTRWQGIMVEPVPLVFERLVAKQGARAGLAFENVAVCNEAGLRRFYTVDPSGISEHSWVDQLGSFSREIILSHRTLVPDIEKRIRFHDVECLPLRSICDKHRVHDIDLLHVDTEGADLEVLRSHDWDSRAPRVVLYEHKHLTTSDKVFARRMMSDLGYEQLARGADTLAVRANALLEMPIVASAWRLANRTWRRAV